MVEVERYFQQFVPTVCSNPLRYIYLLSVAALLVTQPTRKITIFCIVAKITVKLLHMKMKNHDLSANLLQINIEIITVCQSWFKIEIILTVNRN